MRMPKIGFVLLFLILSACTSDNKDSDIFLSLRAQDNKSRTAKCLEMTSEKKIELFFEAQHRHHEYFGFDQCFSSSSVNFISELKSEIERRGTIESLTRFIMIIMLSRQQGIISNVEIEAMNLPQLCRKLANKSPSGNPSECINMANNALR